MLSIIPHYWCFVETKGLSDNRPTEPWLWGSYSEQILLDSESDAWSYLAVSIQLHYLSFLQDGRVRVPQLKEAGRFLGQAAGDALVRLNVRLQHLQQHKHGSLVPHQQHKHGSLVPHQQHRSYHDEGTAEIKGPLVLQATSTAQVISWRRNYRKSNNTNSSFCTAMPQLSTSAASLSSSSVST